MNNIVIAGSRSFDNYTLLSKIVKQVITRENITNPIIISGGARGADELGKRFAHDNNLHCRVFPAQWDKYGKSAGYKRNVEMASISHLCIAFWDGESRGTQHMINICREIGVKTYVVNYIAKECTVYKGKAMRILCQQCNCQGAYGAGLSGAISSKYPVVETKYREAYAKYGSDKMFGKYQIVLVEPRLAVANIFTQYYYGNSKVTGKVYTDTKKLVECIHRIATKYPNWEILIPIGIGCGLAGGDWDDVKRFIDELNLPNIKYVNTKGEK